MNREIKFRGKRVDTGEWVYGCLAYAFKGDSFIMPKWYFATKDLGQEDEQAITDSKEVALGGFVKVEKDSVGEFTSLKDKNGKEIYEGDIVKWGMHKGSEENYHRYAIVEINPDIQFRIIFYINSKTGERKQTDNYVFQFGSFAYKDTQKHLEVIGDISENPELL